MASTAEREKTARIIRRFDKAKANKSLWRDMLSDAYEYALPQRNIYFGGDETNPQATAGQKKIDRVFDSTAVTSTINGANRIQYELMQPFTRWMKLEAGPMTPPDMKEKVNEILDLVTNQFFAVLQSSNFDMANSEALLDWMVGTACLLVLEGDASTPVNCVSAPAAQIYLEEGPWGTICGVYREYNLEAVNIKGQWPDIKDADLPQDLRDIINDDKKCDTKVKIVEATYKNIEANNWCYDVIVVSMNKARILERTYQDNPWIVARYIKVPGEVYGRGPVIQALPDIKTINKLTELVLKNAALHISGVYTGVDDGILNPNTVSIRPGVVIPVASNGGTRGPSLQTLQRSGSFELASLQHEKMQTHIKEMLLDNRLPAESGPVRSPTEILERIKQLTQNIGGPYLRLMQEYIVPLVQRYLNIMERRKLIPKIRVDGLAVQVRVVSPLAQEQNLNDVMTFVRWMTILNSFGPEMVHLSAKTEDAGDWIGEKLGVPYVLRRNKDEREKIMKTMGKIAGAKQAGIPMGGDTPGVELGAQAAGLPLAA